MSAGTPYIGSKINLISKAEIRYQGTLYQVDTKEATVTLAKVRSFGTESRQVPKPIPPRNEIYEFIIFRGSDIKDLNVIDVPPTQPEAEDPAPHQDPAIVSATQAAPLQSHPGPSPQLPLAGPPTHPGPPTYNPFPPPNMYSPFGIPYVRPPVMMGTRGTGPLPPMHPSHPAHAVPMVSSQPQGIAVGHLSHNQPPISAVSVSGPPVQPPVDTLSSVFGGGPLPGRPAPVSSETGPQASSTPMVSATVTAEVTPKASVSLESESPGVVSRAQPSAPVRNQQIQQPANNTAVSDTVDGDVAVVDSTTEPEDDGPGLRGGRGKGQRGGRRGYNKNRQYDGRGGGYRGSNRRVHRSNYRGGGGPPPRGGYRSQGQRPPRGGGPSSNGPVYRYESEFDFESANARFKRDAFEEEFKQLHVDDRSETSSRRASETNGDGGDSLPPPGEEGQLGGGGVVNSETLSDNEADPVIVEDDFYDKSKSFFDSLSCESNGLGRRPDRNAERELNTETFGVSNFRGHRRYQGRGRGRGRGYYGNKGGQRRGRSDDGNYGNRQGRGYTERNKISAGQN